MDRNAAYLIFKEVNLGDTYLEGFGYDDCATLLDKNNEFDFDALINYFCSLNVPFEVVKEFVNGDIAFDTIDGEHSGDDWDYLVIYKDENNELGMYAWTEVLGKTYDIKDYGKTWTERHESEDEIKEREKRYEEWVERTADIFKKFSTSVDAPELTKDTYIWKI